MTDEIGIVRETFARVLGASTYSNGKFFFDDYCEKRVKAYHAELLKAMLVAVRQAPKHYTSDGSGMNAKVVPSILVTELLGKEDNRC
jgi:hypothetical protein